MQRGIPDPMLYVLHQLNGWLSELIVPTGQCRAHGQWASLLTSGIILCLVSNFLRLIEKIPKEA